MGVRPGVHLLFRHLDAGAEGGGVDLSRLEILMFWEGEQEEAPAGVHWFHGMLAHLHLVRGGVDYSHLLGGCALRWVHGVIGMHHDHQHFHLGGVCLNQMHACYVLFVGPSLRLKNNVS